MILRFDIGSVATVGVLFGMVAIFAGVDEFSAIAVSTPGWKVVHGVLGAIFILVGIVAFVRPGDALAALASVIGFFLLLKGIFDVTVSFVTKAEFEHWWMQLVVGFVGIGLAFWVARKLPQQGDPPRRVHGDRLPLEGHHEPLPRLQAPLRALEAATRLRQRAGRRQRDRTTDRSGLAACQR